jgi:DNA-binding NarL/FixJ family response regulator
VPDQPLRVAVVGRRELVRLGIETSLARHAEGLSVLVGVDPGPSPTGVVDVVVADVVGPGGQVDGGLHLVPWLHRVPVVAVVPDDRADLAARAHADGFAACVPLGAPGPALLTVVQAVARGERPDGGLGVPVSGHGLGVDLTAREEQVLTLIARGRSNQQIADELYVSINSVKTYIRTAYRKVGLTSRTQAVLWAYGRGVR